MFDCCLTLIMSVKSLNHFEYLLCSNDELIHIFKDNRLQKFNQFDATLHLPLSVSFTTTNSFCPKPPPILFIVYHCTIIGAANYTHSDNGLEIFVSCATGTLGALIIWSVVLLLHF